MTRKTVCILGGSGFVGSQICSLLAQQGYQIKVLTRRKSRCESVAVLPNTEIIETNIHEQSQLDAQLANTDVVINLVGILNEREHNGDGFRQAHVELTRKVLNACHHNKINRLLHMSALNADSTQGTSHYLRSKGEAENLVHSFSGNTQVTSFRPSVIFGADDSFFNRFAGLLKLSPLIFPLACAGAKFAPVYVGDVANCFVSAINNPETYGKRYDLCGPDTYTLKELVQFTSKQLGQKHWIIALPDFIAQLQAIILEYFPGKPFSIDNYHSLELDSICNENSVKPPCELLHTPETIVPWYLGNKSQQYRDDQFRRCSRRS